MSENLLQKIGQCGQDNLIAGLYPPAFATAVKIAAGAGKLTRGTVLAVNAAGQCTVMKSGGTPAYILAEDKDASGSAAVVAAAYRSGNFNPDAITVAAGYKLTAADKDTLRKYDIIFTQMMKD